jgi:hypothetical protein
MRMRDDKMARIYYLGARGQVSKGSSADRDYEALECNIATGVASRSI